MQLPPADRTPGIPGASTWTGGASPVFVNPTTTTSSSEQFELASWGARLAAVFIDHVIRLVASAVIAIAAFVAFADHPFSLGEGWEGWNESEPFPADAWGGNNLFWLIVAGFAIYGLTAFIYAPAFMARWRGATPGKRMVGIRVVREDGSDIGFGMAFVREPLIKGILINGIGGTFVLVPIVSYLWPLWDRECRAGHDFLAHTRVIKARRSAWA